MRNDNSLAAVLGPGISIVISSIDKFVAVRSHQPLYTELHPVGLKVVWRM